MLRTIQATVQGGVAVSDDFADVPDGTPVTVTVTLEPPVDDHDLSAEQEDALEAACAEADAGRPFYTLEDVLQRLDAPPPR